MELGLPPRVGTPPGAGATSRTRVGERATPEGASDVARAVTSLRFVAELRDQGGRLLRTLPARELQTGAERLALGECELVSGVYVIQVWREAPTADGDWTRETLASEIWP